MVFKKQDIESYLRIQDDLRALIERARAPEDVSEFILDRWGELLTSIRQDRGDEHPDWQAGWDTVHALLWSLSPKQTVEEVRYLLQLLPVLLERLQDGCAALHMEKSECDLFFEHLAMLHAAIVRGGAEPEGLVDPHDFGAEPGAFPEGGEMLTTAPVAVPSESGRVPFGLDELVAGLKPGVRVQLTEAGRDRRLRLQWVSPMRGMYLFTDEQGQDALSMTRAKLKDKFHAGEACLD